MGFEIGNFKEVVLKELESLGYDLPTGATGSLDGSDKDAFVLSKKYYQKLKTSTMDGLVVLQKDDAIRLFQDMYYWQSKEEETEDNNAYLTTWFSPNFELWDFKGRKLEKNASNYIIDFQSLLYTFGKPNSILQPSALLPYMGITSLNSYSFGRKCFTSQTEFNGGLTTIATFKEQFRTRFGFTAQRESIPSYLDYNGEVRYGELDKLKYITGKYVVNRGTNDSSTGSNRGIYLGQGEEENVDNMYIGKNPPRSLDLYKEYNFYIKFTEDWGSGYSFYIPATPWLWFENNNCMVKYNQASGGVSYEWTNWSQRTMIGYQPFSGRFQDLMDEKLTQVDYIAFSNTINIYSYWPSGEYWGPIYALDEEDILNYIYILEGVRYADTTDSAINSEYSNLSIGNKPSQSEEEEEAGETDGNSGDIDWDAFDDTKYIVPAPVIGGKHPIPGNLLEPGFYGGVYIPTWRVVQKITDDTSSNTTAVKLLNDYLKSLTSAGKLDSLVETFIHYSEFINSNGYDSNGNYYDNRWKMGVKEVDVERPKFIAGYDGREGYYPINNKVLTYPYVSFEMNGYGQRNEIKFENWGGSTPTFCLAAKFQPGACVIMIPKNYEGVLYNFDASVTAQPLPIMSYTKDDYKNEYNAGMSLRNQSMAAAEQQMGLNFISAGVSAITGGANTLIMGEASNVFDKGNKGNQGGVATGLIGGAASSFVQMGGAALGYHQQKKAFEAELQDVERRPLSVVNQNAAPSMPALMGNYVTPFCVWKSVRKEFAVKIDEYFSRYGYRVNKYKQPKIKTRPLFNYMQLGDARVTGKIPNADLSVIKQILEKGITFWHNKDVIGDYSRTIHEQNAGKKGKPVYLYPTYENV